MAPGDWVILSDGIRGIRMVVVSVDGRRVRCAWRHDDSVRSDWFARSGLRLVELGARL